MELYHVILEYININISGKPVRAVIFLLMLLVFLQHVLFPFFIFIFFYIWSSIKQIKLIYIIFNFIILSILIISSLTNNPFLKPHKKYTKLQKPMYNIHDHDDHDDDHDDHDHVYSSLMEKVEVCWVDDENNTLWSLFSSLIEKEPVFTKTVKQVDKTTSFPAEVVQNDCLDKNSNISRDHHTRCIPHIENYDQDMRRKERHTHIHKEECDQKNSNISSMLLSENSAHTHPDPECKETDDEHENAIGLERKTTSFRVAKPEVVEEDDEVVDKKVVEVEEEEDSLEATWEAIMGSKEKGSGPHLKKSETWSSGDNKKGGLSKYRVKVELKKWHSFRDMIERTNHYNDGHQKSTHGNRAWSSMEMAALTFHDEFKKRADAFIARFTHDIRLQRLESHQRFLDTINRAL